MSDEDNPFSSLEALLAGGDESEPEVELSDEDEDEGARPIRSLIPEAFCVLLTACHAGYS